MVAKGDSNPGSLDCVRNATTELPRSTENVNDRLHIYTLCGIFDFSDIGTR